MYKQLLVKGHAKLSMHLSMRNKFAIFQNLPTIQYMIRSCIIFCKKKSKRFINSYVGKKFRWMYVKNKFRLHKSFFFVIIIQ